MVSAAAVVVCALGLLGRSPGSTIPITFMESPPRWASPNAEAFLVRHPDRIVLITSTEAFRNAQRGFGEPSSRDGCRKIASVIVHEEWHLQHGDDEEGAYLAQLTVLSLLNAESAVLTGVRRSMAVAVAAQKRRTPQPVVHAEVILTQRR